MRSLQVHLKRIRVLTSPIGIRFSLASGEFANEISRLALKNARKPLLNDLPHLLIQAPRVKHLRNIDRFYWAYRSPAARLADKYRAPFIRDECTGDQFASAGTLDKDRNAAANRHILRYPATRSLESHALSLLADYLLCRE